jgi:sodium/bile acid cotransporter 7
MSGRVGGWVQRWWFLGGLAALLAVGLGWPDQLAPATGRIWQRPIVAAVLFLMALPLEARTMWQAVRRPQAVLLAVAINFGLLPAAAWLVAGWLRLDDFRIGLMVAASVPSTLASAAVWTRRAGGNDAIALFVTMITNVSCFLVTPLLVFAGTGRRGSLKQAPAEMIAELALICVLPVVVAQLGRLAPPVAAWASRRKLLLSNAAQCGILSIVLVGAVKAGLEIRKLPPSEAVGPANWVGMLAAVLGVHLAMLAAGHLLGRVLGIPREDRIAVGFAGSQKTLMVGIHIASAFGGLAILPMVAFHVGQLLVDTLVADWLRRSAARPPGPGAAAAGDPRASGAP